MTKQHEDLQITKKTIALIAIAMCIYLIVVGPV